jgi:hypothetical protein
MTLPTFNGLLSEAPEPMKYKGYTITDFGGVQFDVRRDDGSNFFTGREDTLAKAKALVDTITGPRRPRAPIPPPKTMKPLVPMNRPTTPTTPASIPERKPYTGPSTGGSWRNPRGSFGPPQNFVEVRQEDGKMEQMCQDCAGYLKDNVGATKLRTRSIQVPQGTKCNHCAGKK